MTERVGVWVRGYTAIEDVRSARNRMRIVSLESWFTAAVRGACARSLSNCKKRSWPQQRRQARVICPESKQTLARRDERNPSPARTAENRKPISRYGWDITVDHPIGMDSVAIIQDTHEQKSVKVTRPTKSKQERKSMSKDEPAKASVDAHCCRPRNNRPCPPRIVGPVW